MTIRWYGLVAPEEVPTGDRRMFAASSLSYRQFPLRTAWQKVSGQGHAGAVVVGSWNGQYQGDGGVWGAGEFLDPTIVPEVVQAVYLLEKKLIGPSVDLDPDLSYEIVEHPTQADEFAMKVTKATVNGLTFVMAPAFPQVHITVDTEDEMAVLASAGITSAVFAVNSSSWTKFPLAPRETRFDADTAIQNIAAWSGGDAGKFGSAFLWKDDEGNPLNRETYRLPIVDIFDGKAYLVPRAVFSAGVIMSGGHGGLYDTVDEKERIRIQEVLTDIYDMLRDEYGDPRLIAPWQRGGRPDATSAASLMSWNRYQFESAPSAVETRRSTPPSAMTASESSAPSAASLETTVRGTPTASTVGESFTAPGPVSPKTETNSELAVGMPTSKSQKSFGPNAGALDSSPPTESPLSNTITCSHLKVGDAPSAEASMPTTLPSTTSTELAVCEVCSVQIAIEGSVFSQTGPIDSEGQPTTLTAAGLLKPPAQVFADPKLTGPTTLRVTEDGQVFGHLATWRQCHMGVGNKCVMAPRSATGYAHFKTGSVLTAEGDNVRVGKLTVGTGHADKSFGVVPAAEHYDDTGTCVAVVNAGEDSFGVWVAGALVAGVEDAKAAELRRSPLSGDWRRVNGNLELVAALAVNSPGFPVLEEDVHGQYSLTAAGVLTEPDGGLAEPVASVEVVNQAFAEVDLFLAGRAAADRADLIGQAFHDLLPTQEGCGCN